MEESTSGSMPSAPSTAPIEQQDRTVRLRPVPALPEPSRLRPIDGGIVRAGQSATVGDLEEQPADWMDRITEDDEDLERLEQEFCEEPAPDRHARYVLWCRDVIWTLLVIGVGAFVIAWATLLFSVIRLVVLELW